MNIIKKMKEYKNYKKDIFNNLDKNMFIID